MNKCCRIHAAVRTVFPASLFFLFLPLLPVRAKLPRVLSDFRGIHINVNQNFTFKNQIRLGNRTVCHPRTDHNDHIRLIHRTVPAGIAVVPDHTEKQRMISRKHAKPHHCADNRNVILFRKNPDQRRRAGKKSSAAGTQNRSFRPGKLRYDLFYLHRVSFDCRLVCAHFHFFRIEKMRKLFMLHIDRHIDQNRAFPSCRRDCESFLHDSGNILHVTNDIAVFDKGFAGTGNVRLLKNIAAHQRRIHLPRKPLILA